MLIGGTVLATAALIALGFYFRSPAVTRLQRRDHEEHAMTELSGLT